MEEMMMQSGAMYSEGIYYIYRCTPESGQILKEEADRFHDWLYPSLPDDLCFLKQGVFKLPLALFELTTLEELEIMTADLESIPEGISHLKKLQRLTIYCGSSHHMVSGWKPKPKSELSFNSIPAEIGELTRLVSLNIAYSGIREFPAKLEKLKNLRYLGVTNSLIEETPEVVSRMTWLQHVDLSRTSMGFG
ncbi:leucine-rich repeat domain-containing protein [Paenibacillus sp. ALJ109b]|uniref:leucine-rich repeat domain-containing protein n=1 Tax=Paenibacillus sp. ALJ109b TaxID=2709068 RepID=UPI0013CF8ABA|nr:leucine-rich repeat domain-containing protein [Paenibacillus sp. ALJ109b]NEU63470.1 leucine-rich repeat domain-containing protein [Paenibacillus sp. ALJ109b]